MKKHLLIALGVLLSGGAGLAQTKPERMYVGTYSVRGSKGIYVFAFDRKAVTLTPVQAVDNPKNPSFLAIHPSGRYLYSTDEGAELGAAKAGTLSAYAIDAATGKLTFLNRESTLGNSPCYVSIDKAGQTAFVANYGGGSMAVLPIRPDGHLLAATDSVQDAGAGPNTQRQERAHAHSAVLAPDSRFVYMADLGTDRLNILAVNSTNHTVSPAKPSVATVKPGSGPRHLVFHPSGKFAYLVEELTSSLAVFARNAQTGALTIIEDGVKTLPASFSGSNTSADIHIDPSGRFLYQSNRGRNALAIFAIGADGRLTSLGDQPTEGKTPRNFLIDPKGEFVFVANQETDTITIFRMNKQTGKLTYTGKSVSVPAPVCVLMAR
ncbi:lactonase family protein [Spirosoma luteolum]